GASPREGAEGGRGGQPAAGRARGARPGAGGAPRGGRRRDRARRRAGRRLTEPAYFSSFFGAFFLSSILRASICTPDGTFLFLARSFTSDSRSWERNFIDTGSGTFGFLVSATFTR